MTESRSKRRWFQIHLSTAMVVMLAAAVILWLNIRKDESTEGASRRGWPLAFYVTWTSGQNPPEHALLTTSLILDALSAFTILSAAVLIGERLFVGQNEPRNERSAKSALFRLNPITLVLMLAAFDLMFWANTSLRPAFGSDSYTYPFFPVGYPWCAYVHVRTEGYWNWSGAALNVICAIVILALVALITEHLIRRRKGGWH